MRRPGVLAILIAFPVWAADPTPAPSPACPAERRADWEDSSLEQRRALLHQCAQAGVVTRFLSMNTSELRDEYRVLDGRKPGIGGPIAFGVFFGFLSQLVFLSSMGVQAYYLTCRCSETEAQNFRRDWQTPLWWSAGISAAAFVGVVVLSIAWFRSALRERSRLATEMEKIEALLGYAPE